MESSMYEEAYPLWTELLDKDPEDAEAKIAMKKCQDEIIQKRLLQIRNERISGYPYKAMDIALDLAEKSKEWKVKTDIDGAFFQASELRTLFKFFQKDLLSGIAEKNILKASYLKTSYSQLYELLNAKELESLATKVEEAGKKKCIRMRNSSKRYPFFQSFVNQYCNYFKVHSRDLASKTKPITDYLYQDIKLKISIKGLPKTMNARVDEIVNNGLKKSAWYHPQGKKRMSLQMTGKIYHKIKNRNISKVHEYTVDIPYTAYVPVMRSRQVPYQAQEYKCNTTTNYSYNSYSDYGSSQNCGYISVTKYNTEYYWENTPITKYRKESRVFNYTAVGYHQFISAKVAGSLKLERRVSQIGLAKNQEILDYGHNVNMPNIGLSPHEANLIDPVNWVEDQITAYSNSIAENIDAKWEDNYCKEFNSDKMNLYAAGENVVRCLRSQSGKNHESIDKWHINFTGITSMKVISLIGEY
jgi:hypothetical protein